MRKMEVHTVMVLILATAIVLSLLVIARILEDLSDVRAECTNAKNTVITMRSEKNQLLLEKAGIEKDCITMEQINADLAADNERLKAELAALSQPEEEEQEDALPLPFCPTNIISVEPYRIFDCYNEWDGTAMYKNAFTQGTDQELLQRDCFTETEGIFKGVRYYEFGGVRAYCSALSTNYTSEIGTVFEIELENGYVFDVICADYKNPLQDPRLDWLGTPCTNYDGQLTTCIVEFVVDMEQIPEEVTAAGTFTVLEELGGLHGTGGNVKSIKKLGRWWEP